MPLIAPCSQGHTNVPLSPPVAAIDASVRHVPAWRASRANSAAQFVSERSIKKFGARDPRPGSNRARRDHRLCSPVRLGERRAHRNRAASEPA